MALTSKRVVITGANGNIGRKLADDLRQRGGYDLVLLDVAEGPGIRRADLTRYDEAWANVFADADAVVHFAADRSPTATWQTILPLNVDLLINVYEAARQKRARRLIFASSNWVQGGHRFGNTTITTQTHPDPVNPYGAAKLFGERLGKSLSDRTGMSVINLRIGYNQWLRDNKPGPAMELGSWGQMLWLSDRDFQQVMYRAITVPDLRYATLNVTSRIHGGRWDISETERLLGYVPEDSHTVTMPAHNRLTQSLAWLRDVGGKRLRRLFSDNW
jgi:NAD+ dependent glucose-6-phosphate dehydrogenase